MSNKLDKIFNESNRVFINDNNKIVIMSDCHRGAGDNYDNFIKNQYIYDAALNYYYNKGYIYIELGDGDEMWEVNNYNNIIDINLESFKIIKKFKDDNRLIMIYGNHDLVKKSTEVLEKYFYKYYNVKNKRFEELLNGLVVYESLILKYKGYDMFLIHGHQVDFLNSTLWKLSRILVKNVWKSLEYIGIKDPTKIAKNYDVSNLVEKKLDKWSKNNNIIIVAGHTHRPLFSKVGQGLYFNDGSCIHPNGITCIEIYNGKISLVKWNYKIREDKIFSVKRNILNEEDIISFYK